eukprot:15455724-Alexandrium_andersonii.AAC.1
MLCLLLLCRGKSFFVVGPRPQASSWTPPSTVSSGLRNHLGLHPSRPALGVAEEVFCARGQAPRDPAGAANEAWKMHTPRGRLKAILPYARANLEVRNLEKVRRRRKRHMGYERRFRKRME